MHSNIHESWMHCAEWKKPDYIFRDILQKENSRTGKKTKGCQDEGQEWRWKQSMAEVLELIEMLHVLISVAVIELYAFFKTHSTVH